LPAVLPALDYSTIKNELFPVIAGVFAHTNSLGIKIRGLEAFYILCGGTADDSISDGLDGVSISHDSSKLSSSQVLDKFTIQEKVVPMMKGIKTKEPGVMVSLIIETVRCLVLTIVDGCPQSVQTNRSGCRRGLPRHGSPTHPLELQSWTSSGP
jgi:hypothetical protein